MPISYKANKTKQIYTWSTQLNKVKYILFAYNIYNNQLWLMDNIKKIIRLYKLNNVCIFSRNTLEGSTLYNHNL